MKPNEDNQQEQQAAVPMEYSADMLLGMSKDEREAFFEEHGKGLQDICYDKALTVEQLVEKKDVLYNLTVDLTDTKEEKADVMKDYSDRIKSLETQIASVTKLIRKGTIDVYEKCVKVLDAKNRKVYFFAPDTGQCAKIRDTCDDDFQQVFPFETVYGATDSEGEEVEFVVNRCGGLPEVGDEVKNADGEYELEDGSVITVKDSHITSIDKDDYEENPTDEPVGEDSDDDESIPRGNE